MTESLTLHIDATGGVVRPPPSAEKRVLYYAGAIRLKNVNSVVRVLEMVTTQHDSYSIGNWLLNFKSFCAKQKIKWPLFPQVVTDYFKLVRLQGLGGLPKRLFHISIRSEVHNCVVFNVTYML